MITNIPKEQLVTGNLTTDQGNTVMAAIERLSRSRLHIVFGSGYTSGDVRAYALQVQATEGVKPALVVVDYVQLLRDVEGDGRMRERNVSAAARGLKDVSGELGVPVLALVTASSAGTLFGTGRYRWPPSVSGSSSISCSLRCSSPERSLIVRR